jgi:hypothetical protein
MAELPRSIAVLLLTLIATTWGIAIWLVQEKCDSMLQESDQSLKQQSDFFENHINISRNYSDDYIKAVRQVFLQSNGALDSVRNHLASITPNGRIISHITIMDEDGIPL